MADEPLDPDVLEEKIRSATDGEFLREPDWAACIELSDALNANRNLYVCSFSFFARQTLINSTTSM
jgi:hypothetical protein